MARLFTSGFEFNSVTADVEWKARTAATIITTSPRSGTYCMSASVSSGSSSGFLTELISAANPGPFFLKFGFKYTALPSASTVIACFTNSLSIAGVQAADSHIRITPTGTLQLFNGTTQIGSDSAALTSGTWYEIELLWNNAPTAGSKVLEARLNQSVFATSSTITALNTNCRSAILGANLFFEVVTGGVFQFDDVAVNDSSGSAQNSYPGSSKVIVLWPNAQGDSNGFNAAAGGTAGTANNYTRVNEVPPDDVTSYNNASINNTTDLFNIDNTPSDIGSSDTINAVSTFLRFATNTTPTSNLAAVLEKTSGGTLSVGSTVVPATGWVTNNSNAARISQLILYADPDGTPWTKATLDTTQIGYKIVGSNTGLARVSNVALIVDWTPAPAPTGNLAAGFFALIR